MRSGFDCRTRRQGGAWLALLVAALTLAPSDSHASAGVLLRRARYALADGRASDARRELLEVRRTEPDSSRGLEAGLLLADLDFSAGDSAAATATLDDVERSFDRSEAVHRVRMAKSWLALANGDGAGADRSLARVEGEAAEAAAREIASVGRAWAAMLSGSSDEPSRELRRIASASKDIALRFAAGLTLSRVHQRRGEHSRATHALRALRRLSRQTVLADDLELLVALSELDAGQLAKARRTLDRIARLGSPDEERTPLLSLADLRLDPTAFVARVAGLYRGRADRSVEPLLFFANLLERPAAADVVAAKALIDAAERAAKGA